MKTKIFLTVTALFLITGAFSQTFELTFTAIDNAAYVQLDSVKVMNRTQGGDTVLYWPDTVLTIYYVGIPEISKGENDFRVFQNYPNPVANQTTISLYVPEKDKVSLIITDILGRMILKSEWLLDKGTHSFRFIPGGSNLYYFAAQWKGNNSSIKILQAGFHSDGKSSLEYTGTETFFPQLKATKAIQSLSFNPGDELLYIGYSNGLQSGMLDTPEESNSYTLQFATNIPCLETPTVTYEGQVYNTIQIFSQCWLKENLNIGTMITGNQEMTDNDTIEKYCYNNEPDSCIKYGGIYQWDELMQYTPQTGTQGICPSGWHIATEEDWKVVEGAADSQSGIGSAEWDIYLWRGFDSGKNLKSTSGWAQGGGTDTLGFSGLPAGIRTDNGTFTWILTDGAWWTSSERNFSTAWARHLTYSMDKSGRGYRTKNYAAPIRCIKDN